MRSFSDISCYWNQETTVNFVKKQFGLQVFWASMVIYDRGTPGASVSQVESLPNDIEKFSDGIDR